MNLNLSVLERESDTAESCGEVVSGPLNTSRAEETIALAGPSASYTGTLRQGRQGKGRVSRGSFF